MQHPQPPAPLGLPSAIAPPSRFAHYAHPPVMAVPTECVMTPTPRARKHDISFLVNAAAPSPTPQHPPKRERLLQHSSPVSARAASPLLQPPPLPVPASVPASVRESPPRSDEMDIVSRPHVVACSECPFAAAAPETLSAHARASHPNKPFACRVCGRCFGEKGNMNKHFRTVHLKQRKHQCKTCNRQFAFLDGLNRHISMVHLDRRPFECTECQCPGGRHSAAQMCTHVCGMKFKQKSHRRRHIRSVHQTQPLPQVCLRCSTPVLPNQAHICATTASILGAHHTPVLH